MWLSVILALITALTALISVIFGARKENRKLYRHEFALVFLALATLGVTAYQAWKAEYSKRVSDLLSVDWEKDLDNPITDVRISFIFPNGSMTETSAAREAESFRFELQGPSETTAFRVSHGADDRWYVSKNAEPAKRTSSAIYGRSLMIDGKRYCWWSDSWAAPSPLYMKDSNGKEWRERTLCAIQIGIPLADFPMKELRSLSEVKHISVYLDKDPGKPVCNGDCYLSLVSLLVATKDNQFNILPLSDIQPALKKKTVAWSSTGQGIRERLKLLFVQQNGMSIRESMKERMTPVDQAQRHEEVLRVFDPFHPVSIVPNIPPKIFENPEFVQRFGSDRQLMRQDQWCGFADHPDLCIHRFVVYVPPEAKS
jgi:hypothetical protein